MAEVPLPVALTVKVAQQLNGILVPVVAAAPRVAVNGAGSLVVPSGPTRILKVGVPGEAAEEQIPDIHTLTTEPTASLAAPMAPVCRKMTSEFVMEAD